VLERAGGLRVGFIEFRQNRRDALGSGASGTIDFRGRARWRFRLPFCV
jgi:hypothetical protein